MIRRSLDLVVESENPLVGPVVVKVEVTSIVLGSVRRLLLISEVAVRELVGAIVDVVI